MVEVLASPPIPKTDLVCTHCGTPFRSRHADQTFCCSGCAFVYRLLHERGLSRFYELRDGVSLTPVSSRVEGQKETEWLSDLITAEEATPSAKGEARLLIGLQGLSCLGCVWLVDEISRRHGVRVSINSARGELLLQWRKGTFDPVPWARELHEVGYTISPSSHEDDEDGALGLRLALCGGLAMNAMAFTLPFYLGMTLDDPLAPMMQWIAATSSTLSVLTGGTWFFGRALASLRARTLGMDVPIAAGIASAWIGSIVGWITGHHDLFYFDFVATFTFLMLLGRWIHRLAVRRHATRLRQLDPLPSALDRVPSQEGDPGSRIPLNALKKGDHFLLRPGQVLPVAAELEQEAADLNLEWINGESHPRSWRRGNIVPAGAFGTGRLPLHFRAEESWRDSLLRPLMETADHSSEPSANPYAHFLKIWIAMVLLTGLIGALVWTLLGAPMTALQVLISVWVVSCPCALGVALPMADEKAASWLRRMGVFVRNASLWSRLGRVRTIVFDKTGTLSLELPECLNPETLNALNADSLSALAQLAWSSRHPYCQSLRELLAARGLDVSRATMTQIEECPGNGVRWRDEDGHLWSLGKADWMAKGDGDALFSRDAKCLASFRFREAARPGTRTLVDQLRTRGLGLIILSGDQQERVDRFAHALGIPPEAARGGLSPEDKADYIHENGTGGVLMMGDGVNDRLAFKQALVRGTPVMERTCLSENADFHLQGESLESLVSLFRMAAWRRRSIRRAVIFAISYNVVAIAFALAGWMSPLIAAIIMPLSSLITLAIVCQRQTTSSEEMTDDRSGR